MKHNHPRNIFLCIEGPDNVGKSTLIQNLKNYFNDYSLHTIHYSNVKQDSPKKVIEYSKKSYTEMFELMASCIKNENSGIICDRSHLGEMVYGKIYRNYSGEYVLDIEEKFKNNYSLWNNLFLITLIDKPENLISRDDGLSFSTDLNKKQEEIDLFVNAHDKSTIKNKLLLNIKDYNAEEAFQKVRDFINNVKE